MRWTWDTQKNRTNERRHGLSFETAKLMFDDPYTLSQKDPHPDEQRWRTVGMIGAVIVVVIHTWPESVLENGEEIGRIISARKATARERKAYEEGSA